MIRWYRIEHDYYTWVLPIIGDPPDGAVELTGDELAEYLDGVRARFGGDDGAS